MLKYKKQYSHIHKYLLNELLELIEICNKSINKTMLSYIFIALDKDGRNLHNFSSLRAFCNVKNITSQKLEMKLFKQNSRFEIMYCNIQKLKYLLTQYNDAAKFPDLNL